MKPVHRQRPTGLPGSPRTPERDSLRASLALALGWGLAAGLAWAGLAGLALSFIHCSALVPWIPACAGMTSILPSSKGFAGNDLLAQIEPDEAVETGRETLSKGLFERHPWYDRQADDLKLIPLAPPPATPSQSTQWDWPDWDWDFSLLGNALSVNLFTLLAWAIVLVLAFFLVRYLLKLYEGREREEDEEDEPEEATPADRVEALPAQAQKNIHDLLAEAQRQYEAGNYNEAIVYLYSHLLVQLDRRQRIRLAKGKTNRQYLAEAGSEPDLRAILQRAMVAFEDAYFGKHTLSQARFEACWHDVPRFEARLGLQEVAV